MEERAARKAGLLYFLVHFLVEVVTFYVLTAFVPDNTAWQIAMLFDFFAFVPQGIYGYIRDSGIPINFGALGCGLLTVSLGMAWAGLGAVPVLLVLTVGNGMVHVEGAETTLLASRGKIGPAALFVSGGSFGLITGKLLAWTGATPGEILLPCLLMLLPILLAAKRAPVRGEADCRGYAFHAPGIPAAALAALAVFVVAVRAYMGYGIPTAWNKTTAQTVALFCFMGIGKALGGVLTDKLGIRKTALLSTLGALPFLLLGDQLMLVSLFGVALFSMTMAVTLALLVSLLPRKPGVAFGLTTVGLFIGTFAVAFWRPSVFAENCALVSALTLVSAFILFFICKKEEKK